MIRSRIIEGDVIASLERNRSKPALIFADPPYNQGVRYGGRRAHADRRPRREYVEWCGSWIGAASERLAPRGSMWVLCSEKYADDIGPILTRRIGPRINRVLWRETFGNYQQGKFPSGHRHLFYHAADPRRRTWNADAIRVPSARQAVYKDKRANPKGRIPDDVWVFPRICGTYHERDRRFPNQVPEALLERVVKCATNRGDLVLELFTGSGSMGIVCKRLGRRYLGIEIDRENVQMATARIAATDVDGE